MISARVSPMVELARWLFERQGLPYAEEPHAPILHVIFTRLARGGNEIPVVVCAEGVWDGGPDVVRRLDEKSRPGERLLAEAPALHQEQQAFVDFLFSKLLKQVRRHVYAQLLPMKDMLVPVVTEGAPLWERLFVSKLYPLWRQLMIKGLDFSADLIAQAPGDIHAAFDFVEGRLPAGQKFLGGEAPGTLDIVFSALTAPVIFPAEYGAKLPKFSELPPALRDFIEALRARRAGRLVLDVYAEARGTPQVKLTFKSARRSWAPPSVVVSLANLLRCVAPRLSLRKWFVVSRWQDVQAVLADDVNFAVGPVNAARIEEVSGAFVLGMDRGVRLLQERRALYAAQEAIDLGRLRQTIQTESGRLLTTASTGLGRIDVVNGYARLVAARAAVALFGVAGPSEPDLMRVTRRIFHHTFLNLSDDPVIRELAIGAGQELSSWIDGEIARRRAAQNLGEDFLGGLLTQSPSNGLDDDGIRRTLAGMLVGAIDTTTTAVANIIAELSADPRVARRVAADLDDERRLMGWCWELLRRRPHNPLVLRSAVATTQLGNSEIARGAKVVALTLGAMHDPAAFPRPRSLDPTRPFSRYLHFGAGIHACAGRNISAIQIPELVGALLRAKPTGFGPLLMDGSFPDQLVATVAARTS
jgi:cytochrome P450